MGVPSLSSAAESFERRVGDGMPAVAGKDVVGLDVAHLGTPENAGHEKSLCRRHGRRRQRGQTLRQRDRGFVGATSRREMIDKAKASCLASVERFSGEAELSRGNRARA
jgi:hypothetical protein